MFKEIILSDDIEARAFLDQENDDPEYLLGHMHSFKAHKKIRRKK